MPNIKKSIFGEIVIEFKMIPESTYALSSRFTVKNKFLVIYLIKTEYNRQIQKNMLVYKVS